MNVVALRPWLSGDADIRQSETLGSHAMLIERRIDAKRRRDYEREIGLVRCFPPVRRPS